MVKDNQFQIIRVYNAPVKKVWDAWTDLKKVAQWWGPRGFTITTHSKDLRPGGHWKYTMHGPDGVDYPNSTKYFEVKECAHLVYDHGASDDRPPLFHVEVLFHDLKDKTKMEMTMTLPTAEAMREIRKFIKKAGGDTTWDRLAEFLENEATGKDTFVINRSFQSPIDRIFEVWTNPKNFSQWLAPTGFTMEFIRADIRPGSSTFYSMSGNGMTMYGKANYLEIKNPNRIVYTQQFCDQNEKISRHPMAPTWPETMLTTVTLAEESANQTRVTINWEVHGAATTEERETFNKAKAGMSLGWTGSFDKLDSFLEK